MTALERLERDATNVEQAVDRLLGETARMRKEYNDWLDRELGKIFATIREAARIASKFGVPDESINISKIFKVSLYSDRIWVAEKYQDFSLDYKDPKTGFYKRWHMMDIEKSKEIKDIIGYDLVSMWNQKDFEKQVKEQVNKLMNKKMKQAIENYDSAKSDYSRITA